MADAAAERTQPDDDAAHLLVVDDDTRIRSLLSQYLTERGFRVTVAANAAEARRKLEGLDFDLLVLDVMMAGESGVELTKSLRETKDVPILMLTALSETDMRIRGLEAGADDYISKPFDPRELVLLTNILCVYRNSCGLRTTNDIQQQCCHQSEHKSPRKKNPPGFGWVLGTT